MGVIKNSSSNFPSHSAIYNYAIKTSGLPSGMPLTDVLDSLNIPYSKEALALHRANKRPYHYNGKKIRKGGVCKEPKHEMPAVSKPFVCTDAFLKSEEWRGLRYKALELHGAECQCCGRNRKTHKVVLHVDHIKPRSKFPELATDLNNLQILCEDCNMGKSNKFDTDWR
jgi:5-methylcytosine-specific restriction endonuclease McrA